MDKTSDNIDGKAQKILQQTNKDPSSQKKVCHAVTNWAAFTLPSSPWCRAILFPESLLSFRLIILLHNLSAPSAKQQGKGGEKKGRERVMRSVALICRGWMRDEEDAPGFRSLTLSFSLSDTHSFKFSLLPSAQLLSHHVTCWPPCIFSFSVTLRKAFSSPISSIFESLSPFLLSSFVVTSFPSSLSLSL